MGMIRIPGDSASSEESRIYREASPINHISSEPAPILLIHGDADTTVPFEQSELMEQAAQKAGATVKWLRIPGGGHGSNFQGARNPPDFMAEMVGWFDRYLLNKD